MGIATVIMKQKLRCNLKCFGPNLNHVLINVCIPFPFYSQLQTQGTYSHIKICNVKKQMICNLNIYSSKSYTCEFNNIGETEKKSTALEE